MTRGPRPPDGPIATWRAMLEVHAEVIEKLAPALHNRHGLSTSEFDVLINIAPGEAVRHGDLACRVVLSRSALTRLIDRLVTRGYVIRQPVIGDSRGVAIALTESGAQLRAEARTTNDNIVETAFAPLQPDEALQLRRLAERLLASELAEENT